MKFGYIHLNGWSGRTQQKVLFVRRTPKRVEIEAVSDTKLGGRSRAIKKGERALVPATAFTETPISGVPEINARSVL